MKKSLKHSLFILSFLLVSMFASAQWSNIGPQGGPHYVKNPIIVQ